MPGPARLLLAALLLALTAGCGGDGDATPETDIDRGTYEQRLQDARGDVETALRDIGTAGSQAELARRLDEAAAELRISARELRETEAPPDAEEPTERLVSGMERLSEELETASGSVAGGDLGALGRQAEGLDFEALAEIDAALEELERRGYDVEPVGGG